MKELIVIDAANSVVGRVASYAAKQALFGHTIAIVNCNDALITGRKNLIIQRYTGMRQRGKGQRWAPIVPRVPEKLMKRTIRGMLEYTQRMGEAALDRIRCYNAVPQEFVAAKKVSVAKTIITKTIKLSELAKII
jgi:large subunit ribosomal protein L13